MWVRNNHGGGAYLCFLIAKNLFALSICTSHIKVFRHKRTSQSNGPSVPARGHNLVSGATVAGGGTMRVRFQRGYLRLGQRKKGPDHWEFLGNGLRVSINENRNRQREQAITVADLVDHDSTTELVGDLADGGKSHATVTIYRDFLTRWVSPTENVADSKGGASVVMSHIRARQFPSRERRAVQRPMGATESIPEALPAAVV
jgi:hypothetical protein